MKLVVWVLGVVLVLSLVVALQPVYRGAAVHDEINGHTTTQRGILSSEHSSQGTAAHGTSAQHISQGTSAHGTSGEHVSQGTSAHATANAVFTQVVVRDYSGAIANKAATSTAAFILHVCARNDTTAMADTLTLARSATTILEIGIDNTPGCFTVGGTAGQTINISATQADGTTRVTATLLTAGGATASVAA
jgi:hypothetical protein